MRVAIAGMEDVRDFQPYGAKISPMPDPAPREAAERNGAVHAEVVGDAPERAEGETCARAQMAALSSAL